MPQITLTVPSGLSQVLGTDGVAYPVVASAVTMPLSAVPSDIFATGYNFGARQ